VIRFQVKMDGSAAANYLQRVKNGLADPRPFNETLAVDVKDFTADYLKTTAGTRHATAERLGAKPTEHLSRAAGRIETLSGVMFAEIRIPAATGLRRAFQDFDVVPKAGKKYLTIPVSAEAYGRRAKEFPDLVFMIVGPKKRPVLARKAGNKLGEIFYVLVPKAHIPQDRRLLPSDKGFLEVGEKSAAAYVNRLTATGGAATA
jgi:hypothetical protein